MRILSSLRIPAQKKKNTSTRFEHHFQGVGMGYGHVSASLSTSTGSSMSLLSSIYSSQRSAWSVFPVASVLPTSIIRYCTNNRLKTILYQQLGGCYAVRAPSTHLRWADLAPTWAGHLLREQLHPACIPAKKKSKAQIFTPCMQLNLVSHSIAGCRSSFLVGRCDSSDSSSPIHVNLARL